MPKILVAFVAAVAIFTLLISQVVASGFQLTSIGSVDTTGLQYSEWWYQSPNPTLSGVTSSGGTVEVSVNGSVATVTADGNGEWTTTTSTPEGDHTITLTSNGSVITFTLHIGQTMPDNIATASGTGSSTQPVAGNATPTMLLVMSGIAALVFGLKLKRA